MVRSEIGAHSSKIDKCLTNINDTIIVPAIKIHTMLLTQINRNKLVVKREKVNMGDIEDEFDFSPKFMTTSISKIIKTDVDMVESLTINVFDVDYTVKIYSTPSGRKTNVDNTNKLSYALAITVAMSKFCDWDLTGKEVTINMFDIDKPKKFHMDGEILTAEQVNSAYTIPCRFMDEDPNLKLEIVIFRREECLKVLFHELMHLYSYDIGTSAYDTKRINDRLARIFGIKCNYIITEAYSEFWARILWSMWKVHMFPRNTRTHTQNFNHEIKDEFKNEIEKQKEWSIYQGLHVLINMGLTRTVFEHLLCKYGRTNKLSNKSMEFLDELFDNVSKTESQTCNENTATFSYYVICGIMMSNWEKTLDWCCQTNGLMNTANTKSNKKYGNQADADAIHKFDDTFKTKQSFITLISELSINKDTLMMLVNTFQKMKNKQTALQGVSVSARMTSP